MNVYTIAVLLHYHYRTDEHPDKGRQVPAFKAAIEQLIATEMLQPVEANTQHTASWTTTARAVTWIEHVKRLPLPVKAWRMVEGLAGETPSDGS